jgi:hypothetical protein
VLKWLAVFAATVVYDWLWARYTLAVAAKQAAFASVYSAALFALGGFVIVEYTHDIWLLTAAVTGATLGTWLACKPRG